MFDLIVRGERVVTPQGVQAADLGVQAGRIAAVAEYGVLSDAARTIEAGQQIVMPGGVDPHIHCSWPIPSADGSVGLLTDSPATVSRAALHGGTTSLIDFAVWNDGETLAESIARRDDDYAGQCYCDYAYHLMLQGQVPTPVLEELGQKIDEGYPTVKIFTTDITPSRRGRMIRFGDIWEILKVTAAARGLAVIHAEDNDIVMHMYDKLIAENRVHFQHLAEVHNTLSEELSFRRIIRLAENIDGAALYMMHTSAATGVEAIAESRANGYPIYGETLHQYLMFPSDNYKLPNGQIYHTYPSLKSQHDQAALWDGMDGDQIHVVATDELCCTLAVKVQGERIDDTTGGNAGAEPRLAVMFTEMVTRRGWSLEKFVDLTSTNAARLMGMYPRKGALAPGADADITLLDDTAGRKITHTDLHESDYTPWEGFEASAWPTMTILRGKVMVEGGDFLGELADGLYLKRQIPADVLARRRTAAIDGGRANAQPQSAG
ncbi:MAG: amidohydrolase family protein [Pseudomonadota bacterium]